MLNRKWVGVVVFVLLVPFQGWTGDSPADRGKVLFTRDFTVAEGLGPLFNAQSCVTCHNVPRVGGMGTATDGVVFRVGFLSGGSLDILEGRGGPVARKRSVSELGYSCRLNFGIPFEANMTSARIAPALFGLGLIDQISDQTIRAGAVPREFGIQGRTHQVGVRVGRFGWKGFEPDLKTFVGKALRDEHGITNPFALEDLVPSPSPESLQCAGESTKLEDDGSKVESLTAFIVSLPPLSRKAGGLGHSGEGVFKKVGCVNCHTPSLKAGNQDVPLYSDLLLHDMGSVLNDAYPQGQARGQDWRTTPLWGLGSRNRYLHDGSTPTLRAAILAHDGEAARVRNNFRALGKEDQEALIEFLNSL